MVRGDASNWHIKKQRFPIAPLSDDEDFVSLDPNEFARIVSAETMRLLYSAIGELPPECRKVFRLLLTGKKVAAELLQISTSTVKAQKARGIILLRKNMGPSVLFILYLLEHKKIPLNLLIDFAN
ncbi:RNA polymerase sigma factor [Terrimonas pollutisoli]|uniref:RNA polymerase sigma factor n=1 Tax=Terrimonas pollutisoli TaxID=3034147 RepID=UPI0023EBF83D|nr:hypothetical protein [Terrimonas sp. H1YJ31]